MEVTARTAAPAWLRAIAVRINSRRLPYATLALGALSLFIPFLNYGFSGELTGGDAAVAWALPDEQLRQVLGVYIQSPGLGYNGATGLAAAFPALTLAVLLHALHLSTAIVARLMIALYFFVAMSGAFKLCAAILPKDRTGLRVALLAAVFYGVNRYTVLLYFTAQTYFPMLYSALPWLMYGVVEGCEGRRRRGIAILVFALIWAGGAGSNPALFGVALCAVAAAAACELAGGIPLPRVLSIAGLGSLIGVLCCAWWILPLATSATAGLDAVSYQNVPNWAQWMSERSSFLNLLKLDGYTGADALPYATWYASALGSTLGYIPFAVAVAGFGVYRRRFSAAALVAFCVAAFLSKGVHEPFGAVYQALLDHVPGFSIFRSPFVKWIGLEAVLLALLFALGLAGLAARVRALGRGHLWPIAWLAAVATVAVVSYPWVAYVGQMLSGEVGGVGFRSSLPQAYRDVAAILDREAHGARTVVFGGGALPYPLYTWGYFGADPLAVAARSPVTPFETLLPNAAQMSSEDLSAALRSLAVGFVVVHHDVNNELPSPQANVLVAVGAATPLYRSQTLDLYRLRRPLEAPVQVLHQPLLALPTKRPVPDDRVADTTPGHLDANLGFLLPSAPLAVLTTVRVPSEALGGAAGLGWIEDMTDAPGAAPRDAKLAFVPANPLAVLPRQGHCGRGRNDGMQFVSPVRWRLGRHDLGAFSATLCLSGRRVSQFVIGGNLPNESARTIALINGRPLAIDASEVAARKLPARRLRRYGLPYELKVPQGTTLLEFTFPFTGRASDFSVSVRTPRGKRVGAGGPSIAAIAVPLASPAPADQRLWAYFQSSDPLGKIILKDMSAIVVRETKQRFSLPVDQKLLRSTPLTPADVAVPAVPSQLALSRMGRPGPLRWRPDTVTPRSAWSLIHGVIRLHSSGPATELHNEGYLAANSRYRFTFDYRASGYAELWTRTDGSVVDRITHLSADGRWHRFSGAIFFPVGSSGGYIIRIRSSVGAIEVKGAMLRMVGPNGAILAWRTGAPLGGRLASWAQPHPWEFVATVDDCAPCMLRITVSDPRNWRVRGATVRGTYVSQGGSSGTWGAVTSGAATWFLSAGAGRRTIRFVFWPSVVAGIGLLVSLGSLLIALVVFARYSYGARRSRRVAATPGKALTPAAALYTLAGASLAGAVLGAFRPHDGELVTNVVWGVLLALGLFEWLARPSGSVGEAARVGDAVAEGR